MKIKNSHIYYFDNNATTVVDPLVLSEMKKLMLDLPYNPSSAHFLGRKAKLLISSCRRAIAQKLNCSYEEILFNSGATEGLNYLIKGFCSIFPNTHIIGSKADHAAITNTLKYLKINGTDVTLLSPRSDGAIHLSDIIETININTKIIVLSSVNSETGAITDIKKIAQYCHEKNICLLIDGVAELGKNDIEIYEGIAGYVFSSHKIHGPKGIGMVYLRKNYELPSLIHGGSQEYGKRAGTENIAGIIGFTKAFELATDNIKKNKAYIQSLRDTFEKGLGELLKIYINGKENRICNISNISFDGIDGEDLLMQLDENNLAASHGSACNAHSVTLSPTLLSMGYSIDRVKSSLRFSFSRFNTKKEILEGIDIIKKAAKKISI